MGARRPRLTARHGGDAHRRRPVSEHRNGGSETIVGIHPVAEAFAAREEIERLIVGEGRDRDPAVRRLLDEARAAGIPVEIEAPQAFARFGDARHQHIAAVVPRFAYAGWSAVRDRVRADASALVVVLDHLEDPQNLGAVVRNADGAGATAVVIPDRRSALVTPAARRAAAGAASHVAITIVPNLVRAIEELKADGCWVYGLSTEPGAVSYTTVDYRGRCVLVVGAEGKGLSRLLAERCDRLARVPLRGKVSSLNAASAAAIVLFEAVRQRAQAQSEPSAPMPSRVVNP